MYALVSTRTVSAPNYRELRSALAYDMVAFLEGMGFTPLLIPNNANSLDAYVQLPNVQLVVLSGGNNPGPGLFDFGRVLDDIAGERDQIEANLVEVAWRKNIPLLGICRGFHVLQALHGGPLVADVPGHVAVDHPLTSPLAWLNRQSVNSYHRIGVPVDKPAADWLPLAWCGSWLEAFLHPNGRAMGLQWHPERQSKVLDQRLVRSFLDGTLVQQLSQSNAQGVEA